MMHYFNFSQNIWEGCNLTALPDMLLTHLHIRISITQNQDVNLGLNSVASVV